MEVYFLSFNMRSSGKSIYLQGLKTVFDKQWRSVCVIRVHQSPVVDVVLDR